MEVEKDVEITGHVTVFISSLHNCDLVSSQQQLLFMGGCSIQALHGGGGSWNRWGSLLPSSGPGRNSQPLFIGGNRLRQVMGFVQSHRTHKHWTLVSSLCCFTKVMVF